MQCAHVGVGGGRWSGEVVVVVCLCVCVCVCLCACLCVCVGGVAVVVGAQMSSTVCTCGRCDGLRRVCWGVRVGGGRVGARKYHLQRADVGGWAMWVGWSV